MMKYFILPMIIALLCLSQVANACTCYEINEAQVKSMIKYYDYVFVGSAIEVLHYDSEMKNLISNNDNGYSKVLFKVDSMIKGEPNLKQIVIQASDGSCTQRFKLGEKFVIVGNRVDKVIWNRTTEIKGTSKDDFINEIPPPPPYNDGFIRFEGNRKAYRYWKRLARRHTIVSTAMCTSFRVGSEYADLFLK
tara:strand:+ start:2413 stop:2988 length:576 start_codon:yes stop_codon:yes gene_type:complete